MSAKIKKIVIEVGKHKFELTPKEAKELKEILDDLYGDKSYPIYVPTYIEKYPVRPYITYGTWTISNTDDTVYLSSNL